MDMYLKLKYDVSTPAEAYNYCREHGRTTDLEELVLTSPEYSYLYARYVIGGRWLKGEDVISTSSLHAYLYAKYTTWVDG